MFHGHVRERASCGLVTLGLLGLLLGVRPAYAADPAPKHEAASSDSEASASADSESGASDDTQGAFEEIAEEGPSEAPATIALEQQPDAPEETGPDDEQVHREWRGFFFNISWDRGFRIEEKHKYFQLKVGGRLLADATHISGDSTIESLFKTGWDGGARQARIDFTGTAGKRIYYRLQVDVTGQSDADFSPSPYLKDFFIGVTGLGPLGRLEVGVLKEPISMGVLTSGLNLDFLERGLPTILAPSYNAGFVLRNEVLDKSLSWAFGVFRGQSDAGSGSPVDIVGRIAGVPWRDDDDGRLLHLAVAYKLELGDVERRHRARPETNWGDRWIDTGSIASDRSHLLGLEVAGVWKPVSFQAELLSSWIRQAAGPTLTFWGYYAQVSYFLTGEQRYYLERRRVFGRLRENETFSLSKRTWGAFELTGRYSYLDLDDGAVRGGRLGDVTVGANWYLQSNVRLMLNYTWARLNGRNNGNLVGMRFQVDY